MKLSKMKMQYLSPSCTIPRKTSPRPDVDTRLQSIRRTRFLFSVATGQWEGALGSFGQLLADDARKLQSTRSTSVSAPLMSACLANHRWAEALAVFSTVLASGAESSATFQPAAQATERRHRSTRELSRTNKRGHQEKVCGWDEAMSLLQVASCLDPASASRFARWDQTPKRQTEPLALTGRNLTAGKEFDAGAQASSVNLQSEALGSIDRVPTKISEIEIAPILIQLRALSGNHSLKSQTYSESVFRLIDSLLASGSMFSPATSRDSTVSINDPLEYFALHCQQSEKLFFQRIMDEFEVANSVPTTEASDSLFDGSRDVRAEGSAMVALVRRHLNGELSGRGLLLPDAIAVTDHFSRLVAQSQSRRMVLLPSVLLQLVRLSLDGNNAAKKNTRMLLTLGSGVRVLSVSEELAAQHVLLCLLDEGHKNSAQLRCPLSPGVRLALTARFVASSGLKCDVRLMTHDKETKRLSSSLGVDVTKPFKYF